MWHNQLYKFMANSNNNVNTNSNLSSVSNVSNSYKRENANPIFTGYYGMPNPNLHEQYVQFNRQKGWRAPTIFNRNTLYQKPKPKKPSRTVQNRNQLYERYKSQKKAESDFYLLQAQIQQTENVIANNPHLHSYYALWIQQAKETLKEYSNIIESPDAVSFSSVYGYSKDEDLITLYRHPQFSSELSKISNQKHKTICAHNPNIRLSQHSANSQNSINQLQNTLRSSNIVYTSTNSNVQTRPQSSSVYYRNLISSHYFET